MAYEFDGLGGADGLEDLLDGVLVDGGGNGHLERQLGALLVEGQALLVDEALVDGVGRLIVEVVLAAVLVGVDALLLFLEHVGAESDFGLELLAQRLQLDGQLLHVRVLLQLRHQERHRLVD